MGETVIKWKNARVAKVSCVYKPSPGAIYMYDFWGTLGPMTKLVAMLSYGKTPSKITLQRQKGLPCGFICRSIGPIIICSNDDLMPEWFHAPFSRYKSN